ncbi:MAG: YceI family protein [Bacteroidetes bacterium]|nr:YceI family protein [Bacteroidota bacterium]
MNSMKQFFFPLLAVATLLVACGEASHDEAPANDTTTAAGAAATLSIADGTYVINKVKPRVTWSAQKLTGEGHEGTMAIANGKFAVVDGSIAAGMVVFDMAQIEVTDLTGESKENLEGHLRSGDFFNVEAHPQAILKVTGVVQEGGSNVLNGTLTMNGKAVDYSIPVQLVEAEIPGNQTGLAIQGKFNLDRTKHDITYHSKTFDDKLDWFIKDEVSVGFSVIGVPVM